MAMGTIIDASIITTRRKNYVVAIWSVLVLNMSVKGGKCRTTAISANRY